MENLEIVCKKYLKAQLNAIVRKNEKIGLEDKIEKLAENLHSSNSLSVLIRLNAV